MGQYHIIYNIDKKEFIDARSFDSGLKLFEYPFYGVMMFAFNLLLSNSNGRGGGDLYVKHDYDKKTYKRIETEETKLKEAILSQVSSRWSGDRIVVQGDYVNENDKAYINDVDIENNYTNISKLVLNVLTLDDYLREKIPSGYSWKYLANKKDNKYNNALELIKDTKGRMFRIKFIKKSGEIRELTVRNGVTKHIKGVERKKNDNNLVLYDMNNKSYKTIIKDNIVSIKFNGVIYNFDR